MAFNGVIRHFNDPWPTDLNKLSYFAIGAFAYAVLAFCQYRFYWWPLSPVGIAALIASTVASTGLEIFSALIWFVLTVAIALGFHVFISMPTLVYSFTKRNPYQYMRAMMPALLTGFSTASSSGTLGVTMETAEKRGGVSKRVTSFVLPLGATVNMDGTALFECVTVLFIAQFHAATHPEFAPLGLGAQLLVVFLALAVSIGAAGIPHAGLVMMVIILNAVNLV